MPGLLGLDAQWIQRHGKDEVMYLLGGEILLGMAFPSRMVDPRRERPNRDNSGDRTVCQAGENIIIR